MHSEYVLGGQWRDLCKNTQRFELARPRDTGPQTSSSRNNFVSDSLIPAGKQNLVLESAL